ncbi:hypothetical protein GCM10022225_10370 [Plantactinospora mayteni]|uniref:Uncharacterized protein n=1 Tax=Plantactinospora mayteni TaxID=566021 RepID=A0ABQ4EHL8_9ACTN|nr:hypothetical protein [Plantactinospora mayteni]GIG94214.1 hypothetical protein Pma05_07870 [Plantactinospora mayteni]
MQAPSADHKIRFRLPGGPEQRDRDARMASGGTGWSFEAVAWIYRCDASVVEPGLAGN